MNDAGGGLQAIDVDRNRAWYDKRGNIMSEKAARQCLFILALVLGTILGTSSALAQCDWATVSADIRAHNDDFGASVALSGDFAVVGAPGDDEEDDAAGAAYVFERVGHAWVQRAKLTAGADANHDDAFGASVSISGDTIIVGAAEADPSALSAAGTAYVFRRDGDTWPREQQLIADDATSLDRFGAAVSISGDYAAVGARFHGEPGDVPGAAYVFKRTGTVWTQHGFVVAEGGFNGDLFGDSVAMQYPYVLAGAPGKSAGGGAAYLFVFSAQGWIQLTQLDSSGASQFAGFGTSVAMTTRHAVVGAPQDKNTCPDVNPMTACGGAYVYLRNGPQWSHMATLIPADTYEGQRLGTSVAIDGNTIVVGAENDNQAAGTAGGAAYVFEQVGGAWIERARLTATDASSGDRFGAGATVDGEYILVGAKDDGVVSNQDREGSGYVYRRGADGWGWDPPAGDYDLVDLGNFQLCFTGAAPPNLSACCEPFDLTPDLAVDLDDVASFVDNFVGPPAP